MDIRGFVLAGVLLPLGSVLQGQEQQSPTLSTPGHYQPCIIRPNFVRPEFLRPQFGKVEVERADMVRNEFFKADFVKPSFVKPNFIRPQFIVPTFEGCPRQQLVPVGYQLKPVDTLAATNSAPVNGLALSQNGPQLAATSLKSAQSAYFYTPPPAADDCCGAAVKVPPSQPVAEQKPKIQ